MTVVSRAAIIIKESWELDTANLMEELFASFVDAVGDLEIMEDVSTAM